MMLSFEEMLIAGMLFMLSAIIVVFVIYVRRTEKNEPYLLDDFLSLLTKDEDEEKHAGPAQDDLLQAESTYLNDRAVPDYGGISINREFELPGEPETYGVVDPQSHVSKPGIVDLLASMFRRSPAMKPEKPKPEKPVKEAKPAKAPGKAPFSGLIASLGSALSSVSLPGVSRKKEQEDIDARLDAVIAEAKGEVPVKKPEKVKASGAGAFSGIASAIGSLFKRGNKMKVESQEIDDQLNNVLRDSYNISSDLKPPATEIDMAVKGESITDLEKAMNTGVMSAPGPAPIMQSTGGLPGLDGFGEMQPMEMPEMTLDAPLNEKDMTFEMKDDILSELEESTKVEKSIDLDIMRDMKDHSFECEELESELSEILGALKTTSIRKKIRA